MDLSAIKTNIVPVSIKHPATLEPTGLVFHMRPMSHPEVKRVQRRITDENLRQRKLKITAAQLDSNRYDLIIAAIDKWEWNGDANFEGEKPKLTADTARKVLKADWIRDQIDEALGDDAAFFQN